MDSRVRASPEQLSTLLEYMESHGDLARPVAGAQGRVRSDQLWSDLTNILNSVGGGVHKTTDKWKKVWADLKSKTKKKGLTLRQHARGTGGGPASQKSLSHLEERVLAILVIGKLSFAWKGRFKISWRQLKESERISDLSKLLIKNANAMLKGGIKEKDMVSVNMAKSLLETVVKERKEEEQQIQEEEKIQKIQGSIIGPTAVEGQDSIQELGFSRPQSSAPAPSQSSAVVAQEDDPVYVDHAVEMPSSVSPQPGTYDSQPLPSPPPPPAPSPAPATPRSRRRAAASSAPPARRRPRAATPDTPRSAASAGSGRPRLRARRRLAPTPFERAAQEFSAVELRRLELEEARIRQQNERDMRALAIEEARNLQRHERDTRALEVEHERNLVFSSLVGIAQAWLDYYRSRDNTEPLSNE
ncbi:MAP7 domain-containing protein 1 [Amyelois transitella]|uniref:MAP7 domain-containing protein 1 n=1 Tax=Amyelois transitella TaxID=680683 RepID=UPI00298F7692|nr:MAP7 domain-containing protein 1 [Amyelois transitella]